MNNNLLKFKTVMAYFKSIGEVGFNIDMVKDDVEYFDGVAYKLDGKSIKMLGTIQDYIKELILQNSNKLYNITNKEDLMYFVNVTINPKENKIFLTSKYWESNSNTKRIKFNWKTDFRGNEIEMIYNIFEQDETIERLLVDWVSRYGYTQTQEITLDKGTHLVPKNLTDESRSMFFVKQIVSKVVGNDSWSEESGSDGTLIFNRDGSGTLITEIYNKELKHSTPLIINKDYFNQEKLIENRMYLTEEENDEIFNGYIDIVEPQDSKPSNLNLEPIQTNTRFAKLLNTLLYELYSENLGMNDDNSKYGIIGIYPLNERTTWSILNYFGGHKYVKQRLLEQFNRTKNEKTPREFYKWLIENKETLLKTGPIVKELIRTNFNTYNKGSITEKYVIDILKNLNYDVKYYPPGSKKDIEGGIDIEVNGVSYQIKELIGVTEEDDKIYLKTPLPKNYLGLEVKKIMLVNINTGDFVSIPNKNYKLDIEKKAFVLDIKNKNDIKAGNFNRL